MEGAMATTFPAIQAQKVRLNYVAILVAAVANFLFEAVWYSLFMAAWESGIDRTEQWLMSHGPNMGLRFATALGSAAVMAAAISWVVQTTGPQTAWRGIKVAALLWLGFELTAYSTEYVFEVRPWSLLGINGGFWLIGMILMGAIVGAWKKK
jgi:hypothetical protein